MSSYRSDPRATAFLVKNGIVPPEELSREELTEVIQQTVTVKPSVSKDYRPPIDFPPGFVGELAQWICETGFKRQQHLSIGAALACLSIVLGQRVKTITGMRPNLYVLNVAPTAAGKDHGRRMIDQLLTAARADSVIGGDDIVSDVSVIDHLSQMSQLIFLIDEFGKFVSRVGGSSASSYQQGILDILMKLYSLSDGTYRSGWQKSSQSRTVISQPHVTLFATTTPEQFWPSLNQDMVSNGFLNRFFVFQNLEESPAFQQVEEPEIPREFAKRIADLFALPRVPLGADASKPQPQAVGYTKEAEECFWEAQARWQVHAGDQTMKARDLWKRAGDMCRKTALILSSAGFGIGGIGETGLEEMQWSVRLTDVLCSNAAMMAGELMAESKHEKEIYKLLSKIQKADEGISNRELARSSQYLPTQYRQQLLQQMQETGLIEEIWIENQYRKSRGWKAII